MATAPARKTYTSPTRQHPNQHAKWTLQNQQMPEDVTECSTIYKMDILYLGSYLLITHSHCKSVIFHCNVFISMLVAYDALVIFTRAVLTNLQFIAFESLQSSYST